MHHHDHAKEGMEPGGAGDVAVVGAPEHLDPAIDAFDGGAAPVQSFELLGRTRYGREPPQVDLAFDPHALAVVRPSLQRSWLGQGQPSWTAGQRYLRVPALVRRRCRPCDDAREGC